MLRVIASFDVTLTRMSNIGLKSGADGKSTIASDFAAARAAREVAAGTTQAQYGWQRIVEDPGRCLRMAGKVVSVVVKDQPCSTGSAFVIDGAGTLLTNKHVIDGEDMGNDPAAVASFALQDVGVLMRALVELVGGPPPDALANALDESLLPWLIAQYRCTSVRLHEARITTHLLPGVLPVKTLRIGPPPEWKKSTVVCTVLATGEVCPGKDLAALRVPSLASRLISLPLGDSDRFPLGSNIYALGFPGAAVTDEIDAEAARFRVITHDGIIDQRMPMRKGWEAFHMTANINHGDSGGPVIDENGRVIAINVAGNENAPSQNVAIPINIARAFLAEHQIMLGIPAKVIQTWQQALDALQRGRHAEALPLFEEVNRLQAGLTFTGRSDNGQATEMIQHCRRELGLPVLDNLGVPVRDDKVGKLRIGGLVASPAPAATGFWPSIWQTVCNMPLYQQVMLVVIVLSILAGLFKMLRRVFARLAGAAG
ncbi:MAG TPA: serine protease [Planctomycetota bacterium]